VNHITASQLIQGRRRN